MYFLNDLDKKGIDSKKFWRDLDKLICKNKGGSKIGQLQDPVTGDFIDECQVPNELNTFFVISPMNFIRLYQIF